MLKNSATKKIVMKTKLIRREKLNLVKNNWRDDYFLEFVVIKKFMDAIKSCCVHFLFSSFLEKYYLNTFWMALLLSELFELGCWLFFAKYYFSNKIECFLIKKWMEDLSTNAFWITETKFQVNRCDQTSLSLLNIVFVKRFAKFPLNFQLFQSFYSNIWLNSRQINCWLCI